MAFTAATMPDEQASRGRETAVRLVLARGAARRFHLKLAERLGRLPGVTAGVEWIDGGETLPGNVGLLFELERLIHGLPAFELAERIGDRDFAAFANSTAPNITIDLSGQPASAAQTPAWTVTFDGQTGESALLAALLAKRAPVTQVLDGRMAIASGRIGTEYQGILGASFNDGLARVITLVEQALRLTISGQATGSAAGERSAGAPVALSLNPVMTGKMLARGIVARMYRLCFHSPQWVTGWRSIGPEGDLYDLKRHPSSGWKPLADDGLRFYADPFPVVSGGKTYLFVEDYLHSKGKGIIAAAEFGPNGPLGPFEPVLETPFHLSYPFVFEEDGAFWMIPESNASGTIDLYRATRFPGGWVKEATLVEGVAASDATLVRRNGLWWMFATLRDGGGCYSDALYLWSAPDFRGPFSPHPLNPVLVDAASARPAGRMVERGGKLWRPVQDCSTRYGGALGLAVIDRLDMEGFAQHVDVVLEAGGPEWPGRRLHTLNSAGGLEFIDGSGKPPRRF